MKLFFFSATFYAKIADVFSFSLTNSSKVHITRRHHKLRLGIFINEIKTACFPYTLLAFISGYSLAAPILFFAQRAGVDVPAEKAAIGLPASLPTGTAAPGCSPYTVVGKSPLTGGEGVASSGGNFGPYLKFVGYDTVFGMR